MKCFLGISNILEKIASLSHSIVYIYFFSLITEKTLISPRYSLELCIQTGLSFLFSFAFSLLFFSQLFVRPPQTAILLKQSQNIGEKKKKNWEQDFLRSVIMVLDVFKLSAVIKKENQIFILGKMRE